MKFITAAIVLALLATPAFADEKIRPSGFTAKRDSMSREDYNIQKTKQLEQYKAQRSGKQTSLTRTNKFNKQALNNKANRTFGRDNVNATRTLWSNLNN